MVNKSPRELLKVPATWSMTQVMASLTDALSGSGPALTFGPSNSPLLNQRSRWSFLQAVQVAHLKR